VTTATKITIVRILMIPVFIGFAMTYGKSVKLGHPEEVWRVLAIVTFGLASFSDWVDGYLARNYNQMSKLGAILDPLADKGLVLSAIATLSLAGWQPYFPLWFPLLAVTRDVSILLFVFLMQHLGQSLKVRPRMSGKIATVLQMVAIGWVMLRLDSLTGIPVWVPAGLAGLFVTISGFTYLADGLKQLHPSTTAENKEDSD
jgi:CDP-diacylglycerol--glycerol-3-phosphate 3-phosphatidyltransferase